MISFILGAILVIWCILNRFSEGGKIEGEPLGMPRGTVRALITILLVAFPFGYLIYGEDIPPLIINAIFIAVAFYFEARRSAKEKLRHIVNEIKNPDLIELNLQQKKPLYLPKYTVRGFLIFMLIIIQTLIFIRPEISFQITNTLADLLLIIALFIVGSFLRSILKGKEKKDIKEQIASMDASLSDIQIIEKLMLEEASWWDKKGKNLLSVIMLVIIIVALILFTFEWDIEIISYPEYTLTLSESFILLINVYYGFRD